MSVSMPYFMTNPEWFEYKEDAEFEVGSNYVLTEAGKAIPEVVESYNEFLANDAVQFNEEGGEQSEAMKLFGIKD